MVRRVGRAHERRHDVVGYAAAAGVGLLLELVQQDVDEAAGAEDAERR